MNTLFFGQFIIRLDRVDSTNNYTTEYLRQNVMPEGGVVVAKEQFAGKGQRGNIWKSDPGVNLTCSFFVKPIFVKPCNQFVLNKWVSCAIVQMLEEFSVSAKVKWPNDIYVEDEKIAGILIENSVGNMINHSVIGIGINVNQEEFEGLSNAISLKKAIKRTFDVELVLETLCRKLEQGYLVLKNNQNAFDKLYMEDLYKVNVMSSFRDSGGEFTGTILGVDEKGKLVVDKHGVEMCYNFKEVEFLL